MPSTEQITEAKEFFANIGAERRRIGEEMRAEFPGDSLDEEVVARELAREAFTDYLLNLRTDPEGLYETHLEVLFDAAIERRMQGVSSRVTSSQVDDSEQQLSSEISVRKEDLPADGPSQFAAALSGFRNPVQFMIAATILERDYWTSKSNLNARYRSIFRDTQMTNMVSNSNLATAYCNQSLVPIGLVAQEITMRTPGKVEILGYQLTDAAEILLPIGAEMLTFQIRHSYTPDPDKPHEVMYHFNLPHILGQLASSSDVRAPFNRGMVLMLLGRAGKRLREIDLIKGIQTIKAQYGVQEDKVRRSEYTCTDLERIGLLRHVSPSRERRVESTYAISSREQTITPERNIKINPERFQLILEICRDLEEQGKEITTQTIYTSEKFSRERTLREEIPIITELSQILGDLYKQGYLEKTSLWELTEDGKIIAEELFIPIFDALVSGFIPDTWRHELLEIQNNPLLYAQVAADIYYPYSVSKARADAGMRKTTIAQLLAKQPYTAPQIREITGFNPGTIRADLQSLQQQAIVVKDGIYYRFVGPQNELENDNSSGIH